jgi:hypothetical protein
MRGESRFSIVQMGVLILPHVATCPLTALLRRKRDDERRTGLYPAADLSGGAVQLLAMGEQRARFPNSWSCPASWNFRPFPCTSFTGFRKKKRSRAPSLMTTSHNRASDAARFLRQRSLAAQPERQSGGSRNGNPARTSHYRPPGSRRNLDVEGNVCRISRKFFKAASPHGAAWAMTNRILQARGDRSRRPMAAECSAP